MKTFAIVYNLVNGAIYVEMNWEGDADSIWQFLRNFYSLSLDQDKVIMLKDKYGNRHVVIFDKVVSIEIEEIKEVA